MFKESPFLIWYYWLMGSKIGKNVYLGSFLSREFDLIEVGHGSTINAEAVIKCSILEDRVLKLRRVVIGNEVTIGIRSVVLAGSQIGDGAEIDDATLIPSFTAVPAMKKMAGSPAKQDGPASPSTRSHFGNLFGLHIQFLQLLSILLVKLMGVVVYFPTIYLLVICINNSPAYDPVYSVIDALKRESGALKAELPDYECTNSTIGNSVYDWDSTTTAAAGTLAENNRQCVFPFTYNGVEYTDCTTLDPPPPPGGKRGGGNWQLEQSSKQIVLPWCGMESVVSSASIGLYGGFGFDKRNGDGRLRGGGKRRRLQGGKGGGGKAGGGGPNARGKPGWGVCDCTFDGVESPGKLSGLMYPVIFHITMFAVAAYPILWLMISLPVRRLLLWGMTKGCSFPLSDFRFARHWCAKMLYDETGAILRPLQGTMFLPHLYRLFGARVGRNVEISSSDNVEPHHMHLHDGSFVADSVSLGSAKVKDGVISFGTVTLQQRSFVGNGTVLPIGTVVSEDSLVALQSIAPLTNTPGSSCMGSRAIEIQRSSVAISDIPEYLTYRPSCCRKLSRCVVELIGYLYLSFCQAGLFTAAIIGLEETYEAIGVAGTIMCLPLLHIGLSIAACLITLLTKWVLIGRFKKGHFPLWTSYVWRTEFVERIEVNLAEPLLIKYLGGTNFIAIWFRLLGAKIGARPYMELAIVTEPDLVSIGDFVTLEKSATIQAHLFQDRIRTCDRVKIGSGCSVGCNSVVLLGAEMQDGSALSALSLVMRHESLPPNSKWHGSPAEPDFAYGVRQQAPDFDVSSEVVQALVRTAASGRPVQVPLQVVQGFPVTRNQVVPTLAADMKNEVVPLNELDGPPLALM
jgi:acetyltransferase-like isoleucine patch superfamily enzyme